MVQVVPAIIPKSFDDLVKQTSLVKDFVDLVQVDVMDGKFSPKASWPYNHPRSNLVQQGSTLETLDKILNKDEDFEKLVRHEGGFEYWEDLAFEVDMMVEKPEEYVHDWICAGASAFIIHIGSTDKIDEILEIAKEKHVGIGLAIRPETPNNDLDTWIDQINFVQFMGNQKIGFHGVNLDPQVLVKIKDLRNEHPNLIIGVDIGVTLETAPSLVEAGANKLASGSAIFTSDDIEKTIETLAHINA